VAERAGVSIGSFYQYYPNKQALLVALHQRHRDVLLSSGTNILTEFKDESLRNAIARLVRGIIASHLDSGGLHRSVTQEVPRAFAEPTIHDLVFSLLEDHRTEIGVTDLQLASYLFCVSAKAVIHDALGERPHDLRNGKIESGLVRMLANYLAQSR
jgi:AcrR family transcriptional regulator